MKAKLGLLTLVASLVMTVGVAAVGSGCVDGKVDPRVAPVATLTAEDTICVLTHLGEAPLQIVADCGIAQSLVQAVTDLQTSAKKKGVKVTVNPADATQ